MNTEVYWVWRDRPRVVKTDPPVCEWRARERAADGADQPRVGKLRGSFPRGRREARAVTS